MVLSPDVGAVIEELLADIAGLRAHPAAALAENVALKQEMADLRRRLDEDSSNSSKPPSRDGPSKKPRIAASLRGVSGKTSGGRTRWLHTASTAALTHDRVSEKPGAIPDTLRGGVIVHDHFKPYFTLPRVEHALYDAHHLRELKAPIDIEEEP